MADLMNAAFFDGEGTTTLRRIPIDPPDADEVLVAVKASGVCGSDLHQLLGRWPQREFAVGHEVAGVVSAVGPEVAELSCGDRVCIEPFSYCGSCRYCLAGRYFHCVRMGFLTLDAHGGFAEFVTAPCYGVYRLPDTVSLELGALAEPLAVAVHGTRLAGVSPTDDVLVLGAGTIGLMSVAAARHFGARRVYVTARYPHQAEAALALGAVATLSTDTETLRTELSEHLERGPDVVLETVGSAARTFQQAIDVAGKMGRVAVMGGNTGEMDGIDLMPVISKELVIYGSGCYSQIGLHRDFDIALAILASQPQVFEGLITHRYSLEEIKQAFETALDKPGTKAIKVMVVG